MGQGGTRLQATLARPFSASGAGLHTGRTASVTVGPAPPDAGIVFTVHDGPSSVRVRPDWRTRAPSRMNTALALGRDGKLRTIEHLMASLSGLGIDNARVEVRGRELPILDGSAAPWCDGIADAGIAEQDAPRRYLAIRRPVQVRQGRSFIRGEPHRRLALDVTTDQLPGFGPLGWCGEITPESFVRELAPSRSFGRIQGVWTRSALGRAAERVGSGLRAGLRAGLGGALDLPHLPRAWSTADRQPGRRNVPCPDCPDLMPLHVREAMRPPDGEPLLRGARPGRCAVVIGRHILGGARFPDEPVRHKALDLLGDLTLAGAPLLGRIVAHRPTHALAYAFVAALIEDGVAFDDESPRRTPAARPRALAEAGC